LSLEDLTRLPLPESGGPGDLHAALEKAVPEPATTPGELSLEEPPVSSEPAQEAEGPAVPESLTLEGLLSTESAAVPTTPEPESAPGEQAAGEPVFDLTSEMGGAPLPLVEVGTGEPPALSIEDLLVPKETAAPDAAAAGVQELELELTPDSSVEETPVAAPPLELEGLAESAAEPPPAEPPRGVAPSAPAGQRVPAAAPAPSPGGPAAALPDTAAMRQAVTERVARELAVDLSDKLLERIERIVWDVVPELAEILIAKEIEKIRAVAEGKQPS
jgi:hypothetical protein